MKRNKLTLAISQIIGIGIIGMHNVNAGSFKVTSTLDSHTDGLLTFREAIDLSNSITDTIFFDAGVFATPQTITLTNGDININAGVTIEGPGADILTIDGDDSSRVLTISDEDSNLFDVNISGIKLQNGNGTSAILNDRGGCILSTENLTLNETIVTGCTSNVDGGGIWSRFGTLRLNKSTISNNKGGPKGGGVYVRDAFAFVKNTTISGNTIGGRGGGLFMDAGGGLQLSTVSNNTSLNNSSGGIYAYGPSLVLQNSILAGNNGANDIENNGFSAYLYNSVLGTAGPNVSISGTNNSTGVDPELGPLQNNGGTTPTHSISLTSPALNRGDSFCLGEDFDQRGELRDDFACDSGAFERQGFPNILVDTVAFNTASDGFCSILEAVDNANFDNNSFADCATGEGADSIGFSSSLNGMTIMATSTLSLNSEITFDGPGADQLSLSGGDTTRILEISPSATITINGLSFIKGFANLGGAIINAGHLTLNNSVFNNNNAEYGGAIYSAAITILNQVSMDNNIASDTGGAIYHGGSATMLQVNKSSFTNNMSEGNYEGGGAMSIRGPSTTISQSTFVGNSANLNGGAIHQRFFSTSITNSTFSNNTAGGNGGGIAINLNSAITDIRHSTFSGNTATGDGASIFSPGTLNILNTILTGNGSTNECIATTITTNLNNLIEDGSCSTNASDLLTGDPLLAALADNGGFTLTHLPMVGSPVIDTVDFITCALIDQRGVNRPIDGDGDGTALCDIGAVEVANPDIIFKNDFENE